MRDPLLQSGSDRDIDTISWVVVPTSHWKDFVAEWCVPKVVVGITMGILLGVCLAVVCIVPWVPNMPANAALSHSSVTVKVKAADPLTTPPEKVDQERKQFVPFDYKSRDAVDMYCLCRSYSMSISELKQANKRATRAARVCCEEVECRLAEVAIDTTLFCNLRILLFDADIEESEFLTYNAVLYKPILFYHFNCSKLLCRQQDLEACEDQGLASPAAPAATVDQWTVVVEAAPLPVAALATVPVGVALGTALAAEAAGDADSAVVGLVEAAVAVAAAGPVAPMLLVVLAAAVAVAAAAAAVAAVVVVAAAAAVVVVVMVAAVVVVAVEVAAAVVAVAAAVVVVAVAAAAAVVVAAVVDVDVQVAVAVFMAPPAAAVAPVHAADLGPVLVEAVQDAAAAALLVQDAPGAAALDAQEHRPMGWGIREALAAQPMLLGFLRRLLAMIRPLSSNEAPSRGTS
ncbi:unnamed protein product [Symbiodinium sp. KB8]|nr:unnamed protein product [Symbiodinium sp. KB8]